MKERLVWNSHNWLVHKIIWEHLSIIIPKYARGRLLDIGCSDKPYELLARSFVDAYVGLDHLESQHALSKVDIIANAYCTGIKNRAFDTILSTSVLEHLERPSDAIHEMYRILNRNGRVILTCPLFWHIHKEPRDFYRYIEF